MFISDNHVHTNFSSDSTAPMEVMIRGAIAKGIQEMVLTDHLDFDYPGNPNLFLVDWDQYLAEFYRLKDIYQKQITILFGVEIGAQPHVIEQINQVVRKYPFDFVICSTHTVDRVSCSQSKFFASTEPKAAYLKYLEGLLANIKSLQDYDVCGHLDFIARYNPSGTKQLSYGDYADVLDTILKTIIESGHGIELNTSGYRYGLKQAHPSLEILLRYRQLGGEIITVGSDSHKPEDIGFNSITAYELLRAAGFHYITHFKERKAHFINLDRIHKNYAFTA